MSRVFTLLIYCLLFIACSNEPSVSNEIKATSATASAATTIVKDTFPKATVLPHVACLADASQSYALYIPATSKTTSLPVVFCFDPHGDGALPLQQYKALADEFDYILIGSNNSKNGNDWNTTQNILATLFADVQNRIFFNHDRMYALGFSGGAKVAGYAALHSDGIKGIITAGAGLPEEEPIKNFPFSITAMAGRGDMNMTDLIAMNETLNQTSAVHRLILFDGKHAWPPASIMHTAFAALQFDAMRNSTSENSDLLVNNYITEAKDQIRKEEANHQWLPAEQTCMLAGNLLMNLTDTKWFSDEQILIKKNPAYTEQQRQTQQLLEKEEQTKQVFRQQFPQGDRAYWQTTISTLQQKAKTNTPEASMNQRLLAFLSLAFYSLSNRFISSNQNEAAEHFVTLYKLADESNPEAWYFSAVLNARSKNGLAAQNDLVKAASLGFIDTLRLHQQPEFQAIISQLDFRAVESKMRASGK